MKRLDILFSFFCVLFRQERFETVYRHADWIWAFSVIQAKVLIVSQFLQKNDDDLFLCWGFAWVYVWDTREAAALMHNAEQMSPNNMKHVQSRKTLCAAQSAQYVGDGSHDIIHTVHPVYVQIFDFIGARAPSFSHSYRWCSARVSNRKQQLFVWINRRRAWHWAWAVRKERHLQEPTAQIHGSTTDTEVWWNMADSPWIWKSFSGRKTKNKSYFQVMSYKYYTFRFQCIFNAIFLQCGTFT